VAPQNDKEPKDPPNNKGINIYFPGKDRKDRSESLERLEQGMNNGAISPDTVKYAPASNNP
jgi:hypothetical protein